MRSFIEITGNDRVSFLQGIVTQDVTKLAASGIQFAGLLSPQGKLLHDMFLVDLGERILIDTAAVHAPTLLKRLTMYKLRAKVALRDATAEWHLILGDTGLSDPRLPELPKRAYHSATSAPLDEAHGEERLIHQRITLGVPEFGVDILPDSITAMDAGYDLLHAISFSKGCYVGQEVTARMHYKNIARKGFFRVTALEPLANGAVLMAGARAIGTLTSADGLHALAFLKFDDAALENPTVDNQNVYIAAPGWMQPKLALFTETAAKQ